MNVFVLCTGRCGSTTFARACEHITNYSAGHETRSSLIGADRFNFPEDHIEADNRLSWFLGKLEKFYGDNACYVHLKRERDATAHSFLKRYNGGIVNSYANVILSERITVASPIDICLDYCDTVDENISCFLKNKSRTLTFQLEQFQADFPKFWQMIAAQGDLDLATAEFGNKHNATPVVV